MIKVAPYGFLKSEKMQISTLKTAYRYFGKKMKLKLCIEQLSRHQVPSIDKVLRLLLWQQWRIKMSENLR